MARITDIITLASRLSDIPIAAITGRGRFRKVVRVRQAAYFVARQHGHTYPQIGLKFNKDHSSVIHGANAAAAWAERVPAYAEFLRQLDAAACAERPFIPVPGAITSLIADIVPRPAPKVVKRPKPKNDFTPKEQPDGSHAFQEMVSIGSAQLLAAINTARLA